MEFASVGGLRTKFYKLGKMLKGPSLEKSILIYTLENVVRCLCLVKQSNCGLMISVLDPLGAQLVRFLGHTDPNVRLVVITCISEIMRIKALKPPYNDHIMKEIFQLMLDSFEVLYDITNVLFAKRVTMQEIMANIKS